MFKILKCSFVVLSYKELDDELKVIFERLVLVFVRIMFTFA